MKTTTVAALLLASAALELQAQSFSENFNTPGSLANNFNVYLNSTTPLGSPYAEAVSGGVGNSGSVSILPGGATVTQDATLIQKNTIFNFSQVGVTLRLSTMLNVSSQTAGGNRLLQLGFVNESTSGMNGNPGLAFMSLRLSSTSGNIYTPQFQTKTAAGGTVNTGLTPDLTLTVGNWYELSGSFLSLGGGQIQASGVLQDFGTDGLTPGAIVFTFPTTTLTSADIATDSTVFAGLRGFKNDGLNTVDNFVAVTVVPEPSAAAVLILGLAALAARPRKENR
jgi:hypothetical protein